MSRPSKTEKTESFPSVYIVSLGCPKNRVDSEVILTDLQTRARYRMAPTPEEADLLIVNTCAFIESAKEESIETILEMAGVKAASKRKPKLLVAGCLSQRYSEALVQEMPEVDFFVGTGQVNQVSRILGPEQPYRSYTELPGGIARASDRALNSMPSYTAYLKISEGCSNACAFCVIPQMRGNQISRTISDIVAEAQWLVKGGALEINLVAQDLTAYGYDLEVPKPQLSALLRALDGIRGLQWLRLLYAYPRNFPDELIDAMAQCTSVVPYLDMPIQHVNERLLREMRRGTPRENVERLLKKLRAKVPNLNMRTTFIVGLPTETEAEFEELCGFVREYRFEHLGVFKYSQEEGTLAGDMAGQIEESVKEDRYQRLMAIQREISEDRNESLIGAEVDVLVEGVSDESELLVQGRTPFQAPEIDGVTYINSGEHRVGSFVRGRIVEAGAYDLVVEPLPERVAVRTIPDLSARAILDQTDLKSAPYDRIPPRRDA